MKKSILAAVLFLMSLSTVFAQKAPGFQGPGGPEGRGPGGRPKDGNRIESLKIAFITRKLDLSPEEAQKFWPVYNKYAEELKKTHQELRNNNGTEIEKEEKMLTLRKKYNLEFQKVLSSEKANNYFRVEKEFVMVLQKEMQKRHQKPE